MCRNRRRLFNDPDRPDDLELDKNESFLESQIYLTGSLNYLEQVGMNRAGRILDMKSDLISLENLDKVFNEYCAHYLDLENVNDYKDFSGSLVYTYFLRVYKTAFFWKKIYFEKRRVDIMEQRRGFLFSKDMEMYKLTHDKLQLAEENCLQKVLNKLYDLLNTTEEQFQ
jgi:hypothetical protein